MMKNAYKIAEVALMALAPATIAFAQGDSDLCRRFDGFKDGSSLIRNSGKAWQVASRRSVMESMQVGFSLAKGELAHHLTNDKPGYSVRWSGAIQRGPIKCGGYNVVYVAVDVSTISFVLSNGNITGTGPEAIDEILARWKSGKATKEDLQRLRDYYAEIGDLMLAKRFLEESLLK